MGTLRKAGRHLVVAGVALGALLGVGASLGRGAERAGELVAASGPVEVRHLGEAAWRPATLRAVLQPGDMVRTGPGGSAEVALVQGVFRMDENTVIILPPRAAVPAAGDKAGGVRLLLYKGRALFQLLQERLQGTFDVITPSVIVGVKGTAFGVEQGAEAGVVVFEGAVEVVPTGRPEAPPVTVGAGQFVTLRQGQLTPPQPFQPGAPGMIWQGAPMRTQSRPLPAAPGALPAPSAPPAAGSGGPEASSGVAAPALAEGDRPSSSTPVGPTMAPPKLTSVGGPPGSSNSFPPGSAGVTAGGFAGGGGDGSGGGNGKGGSKKGFGQGGGKGKGKGKP